MRISYIADFLMGQKHNGIILEVNMGDNHELNEGCKIRFDNIVERIEKIEYKIEGVPVLEELVKQLIESKKEQNKTFAKFNDTLIKVSNNMDRNNDNMDKLSKNQDKMQEDLQSLKDERSFNIILFLKSNWFTIILGGITIYKLFIEQFLQ